ncbi:MAG: MIP/aquaporin family protein [Bacilli bacterium]
MKLTLTVRQFLAEFYGTFILVLVGTGSIAFGLGQNLLGVAFAFGTGALVAIYTIGHISGAHLNPAVSLAMVLDRRMTWKQLGLYVVAQTLGAFFASLTLLMGSDADAYIGLGSSGFAAPNSTLTVIIFEMFLTFILVYTVLATSQRKPLQPLMGFIVALTLVGLILVGGPITSASLNPVRSIAPALLEGGNALAQLWVYIVGPILGSILAAIFYRFLKFKDSDTI